MLSKTTFAVLTVLTAMLCGCTTINKYRVLLPPGWSDMEAAAAGLYVNRDMATGQRQELIRLVDTAQGNLVAIWGSAESRPAVFACSVETCFQTLGGSDNRAHAVGSTAIVLSPRALNTAMIAHEWSHSELYRRVGGLPGWLRIPNWFDEGVAVMVSRDHGHGPDVWLAIQQQEIEVPSLNELNTHSRWTEAVQKYRSPDINPDNLAVVYATAGNELRQWYARAGQQGLLQVIEAVGRGGSFAESYRQWKPAASAPATGQ